LVATAEGDNVAARRCYEEALGIERELGDRRGLASALNSLGVLALDEGDREQARRLLRESLGILRDLHDRHGMASRLEGLAGLAALEGAAAGALRLAGAVAALRDDLRFPAPRLWAEKVEGWLARARAALGHDAAEAAWTEGRALSLDEAIQAALDEVSRAERG
jgi:non-specific serine/threonine protein kinase